MTLTPRQINLLKHTFLDYQQTSEFLDQPLVVNKADGLYVWDIDGKRYFDAIGGIFVASLGHRHPRVHGRVHRQMEQHHVCAALHGISDDRRSISSRRSVRFAPGTLTYVKPFSGGSEAIESALKFVRQYFKQTGHPGKYKFISRYYGYHGGTFGGMAASGTGPRKSEVRTANGGLPQSVSAHALSRPLPTWEDANRFAAESLGGRHRPRGP